MDVPESALEKLTHSKRQAERLRTLSSNRKKLLQVTPSMTDGFGSYSRVYVNMSQIGKANVDGLGGYQGSVAGSVVGCLNDIALVARDQERERPRVVIWMPSQDQAETTLGMSATVLWPRGDDSQVGDAVTQYMRSIAYDLRYLSADERQITQQVRASVSSENGVELYAHQAGRVSLATEAGYCADADALKMTGRNITNDTQRLILFSGVVALANAGSLDISAIRG